MDCGGVSGLSPSLWVLVLLQLALLGLSNASGHGTIMPIMTTAQ